MGIFKSLYRWKSKVKSIAFLSSREHSRMNSSNLESLQRTMTYRTTLERPTIRMTFSRRLRMPMMASHPCLTTLGGGQDGDLIMAFFPCIYFCENNELYFTGKHMNLSRLTTEEKIETILHRSRNRQFMYELCLKLFCVCDVRNIRLIVENPYSYAHYLVNNFPYKAVLIDRNRSLRGDFFNKPTQYWFLNCEPTHGFTEQSDKDKKKINMCRKGKEAGICSEERSMISPDYARNFICDFILGKPQPEICPTLFDAM